MPFLDSMLNPVLLPLLKLGPFFTIFVLSFIISLIIVLVYKYFTNQEEMKRLKELQKEYTQKIKGLKDKPEEMMRIQKEAMQSNFQYMKHSFKATLITMLPVLLLFGWMNGHLAYEPIFPEENYSLTAKFAEGTTGEAELIVAEGTELLSEVKQPINSEANWRLKSKEGDHQLTVKVGKEEQSKNVLITKELKYEESISFYENSAISSIQINYNKLRPLGGFSMFGWQPGWLGIYIILSIIFSIGLRKVFNVY